ncbi:uncharacterized protein LOC113238508, partial [Hyposmocoma kahamanoa]|uniref:uncharacterized protein LOC113238508 n=1 Tax=Hyposmocoma kahamanoa TaxID=1477025 RepID=UPI000E6D67C5
VKPKVASTIYDRLDELAVKEHNRLKLGGRDRVVLTEMYPDCLTRLSPDTTDQPHVHRVLMMADTNHVPTHYQLHVIKDDLKKNGTSSLDNQSLRSEIEEVISEMTLPESTVVTGSGIHAIQGASSVQEVIQLCDDIDMAHFLTSRIWRQAITLCTASRDLCSGSINVVCANAVQRYLLAALYRLRFGDGFYEHILRLLANEYTGKSDV